jgi:hypothetical protein
VAASAFAMSAERARGAPQQAARVVYPTVNFGERPQARYDPYLSIASVGFSALARDRLNRLSGITSDAFLVHRKKQVRILQAQLCRR